ncbi:hypothetical protein [Haliangium sp.]|uniref:hypothetical protein n=1 Tax=Haliangium sp. TaxID=2663208 RepID=UPI003D106B8F
MSSRNEVIRGGLGRGCGARARARCAGVVAGIGLAVAGCGGAGVVSFEGSGPSLTVRKPALYPETIEYDRGRGSFLLSSFREGRVYAVDDEGEVSLVVDDDRLCSVLGLAVDATRGRLWAVTSDLGVSVKESARGPKKLAAVGVYDLATGEPVDYVDLAALTPGDHLANGIAVDSDGNAYVTDSFSPVIYKIDAQGRASVFLRDEQFAGDGISLNGVVVHPDGYLLVVKKSDGTLFRVPLDDPARFSKVDVADRFKGGDGLLLVGEKDLVIIANQASGTASNAAFSLSSQDGWGSARLDQILPLGAVYPTTGVVREGRIYVVHSKLNELIQSSVEDRERLRTEATIQDIGHVAP